MGNGARPHRPSSRAHPRLHLFDPQKIFYIGIIVIRSGRLPPSHRCQALSKFVLEPPTNVRGDSTMKDILATVPSFIAALTFAVLAFPCLPVIPCIGVRESWSMSKWVQNDL